MSHSKANPFLARITQRYNLCKAGSRKSTFHIVLSLEGSGITYRVGDSIAVQPVNDPEVVVKILELLEATGEEIIADKHTKEPIALKNHLEFKADLATVPRKLISELALRQTNTQKKERLEFLGSEGERLKEYRETHEVWDALAENQEVRFDPEEFCRMLQPLLPRFYSISSSMNKVGNEVHLLVGVLDYETNGHQRTGVCTD